MWAANRGQCSVDDAVGESGARTETEEVQGGDKAVARQCWGTYAIEVAEEMLDGQGSYVSFGKPVAEGLELVTVAAIE